jgi:putative transposase
MQDPRKAVITMPELPRVPAPSYHAADRRRLKELIQHACGATQSDLIEMEVMPDHVHLLDCDPQFGIHRLVRGIKGRTSRVLRQEFQVLRTRLPTLLTNSYFASTAGGAPLRGDQAIYRKSEARLMRAKTSSFVAELPLCTTAFSHGEVEGPCDLFGK